MVDLARPRENYASIDMMRGLAILLVTAVHVYQVIPGTSVFAKVAVYGQMGVQLFFVASAFTLCNSYAYDSGKPHRTVKFWIRRYFRIAPGYYFGIILYLIVGSFSGFQRESHTLKNVLLNVFLVHGLAPTDANNQVMPGGWSIGTEVLFYLLFPFLFSGYSKIRRKIWLYLVPPVFLGMYYPIVLSLNHLPTSLGRWHSLLLVTNNSFSYFSFVNQMPVFLAGMSLWFLHTQGEFQRVKAWQAVVAMIVLNCMGLAFFSVFYAQAGASWQPFILVPFMTALGMASIFVVLQITKPRIPILNRIGVVSYSGYLLNAFIIYVVAGSLVLHLPFVRGNIGLICSYIVITAFLITCATFVHSVVEKNGIRLGKYIINKTFNRAPISRAEVVVK